MIAQPTRTAVYGPVRTVVWQGSAGDRRPYADLKGKQEGTELTSRLPTIQKLTPIFVMTSC